MFKAITGNTNMYIGLSTIISSQFFKETVSILKEVTKMLID